MKVGGIWDAEIILVIRARFDHQHGHVHDLGYVKEFVAPITFLIRQSTEIPCDPPTNNEMVSTSHDLPFRSVSQPASQCKRRRVSHRDVSSPKMPSDVEPRIEGHVEGSCFAGIVRQAIVLLHPVMKYDIHCELIGGEPTHGREDAFGILQGRSQTGIFSILTHVGPRAELAAMIEQVLVEGGGEVVHVDILSGAGIALVMDGSEGTPERLRRGRGAFGRGGREFWGGEGEATTERPRGFGQGKQRGVGIMRRRASNDGEMEREEQEPKSNRG